MKKRHKHLMLLSDQVLAILQELRIYTGQYQLVFPVRCNTNKPMSEASINIVIKRIGYNDKATAHGFRHTMSTILHEQGLILLG